MNIQFSAEQSRSTSVFNQHTKGGWNENETKVNRGCNLAAERFDAGSLLKFSGRLPDPTAETKLLTNAEEGYCLLYLAEHVADMPGWVVINPNSGPGDMPGEAWLNIQLQDAAGRTAAQVADEMIASLGAGFKIARLEVQVDGSPATVLDGLPGLDSNRMVMVVHNDRLYILAFLPWQRDAAEPAPLENLYTTVMDTFHFLPQE